MKRLNSKEAQWQDEINHKNNALPPELSVSDLSSRSKMLRKSLHSKRVPCTFTAHQLACITEAARSILRFRFETSLLSHDRFSEELGKCKAQQKTLEMRLKREFSIASIEEKARKAELLNVADLNDRVHESLEACKSDSQAYLTEYRNSNKEREQDLEIKLKKLAGMLTVAEGDYKSKTEGVKLKAISLLSGCLLAIFGMIMGERMIPIPPNPKK